MDDDRLRAILTYKQRDKSDRTWFGSILFLGVKIGATIFFYAFLTPVAIGLRILGIDLLGKNFNSEVKTYWQQCKK